MLLLDLQGSLAQHMDQHGFVDLLQNADTKRVEYLIRATDYTLRQRIGPVIICVQLWQKIPWLVHSRPTLWADAPFLPERG